MLGLRLAAILAASGVILLAGSAAARPATTPGTTWKLVQTTGCASPKKAARLACWDPEGRTEWQVSESSATWTATGWDINYKYTIPATLPPAGAQAQLAVTVTDRDPAGASGQVCIASGFVTSSENCARASAPKGQSSSGSASVTLKPSPAPAGSKSTLVVALGDGGRLYFTYEAQGTAAGGGTEGKTADCSQYTRRLQGRAAINEVRVVCVEPNCEAHKAGSAPGAWITVTKDLVLKQSDEVGCDPDGLVVLAFADNSTVVVRNTTQLKIASFFTEGGVVRTEILLKMGEVAAEVNKSEATKSDFHIQSPSYGSVRGTTFSVFRDPVGKAEVWSLRTGELNITPIGGQPPLTLRPNQEVEITPTSVSKIAPIGKAGARGGVTRVKARDLVLPILARAERPCRFTTPRSAAFSVKPSGAGWLVSIKVTGKLKGWSTWQVAGRKVTPANPLAKKIAACR